MSDDKPRPHDETQPVRPEGATAPPPPPPPAPAAQPDDGTAASDTSAAAPTTGRRGFRDRLRGWRRSGGDRSFGLAALVASALAGIIVGGLGVAAFQAVTDDHDRGGWIQRHETDGDRGPGGRGGMDGGPRGVPGQLPPTTSPEDEDSGSAS